MSLFNRPAWAKAQPSELDDSEQNIFSHSRTYQQIVAEEQRKKQAKTAKLEKQKAKQERRVSAEYNIKEEGEGASLKRRRITFEEGSGLLKEVGVSTDTITLEDDETQAGAERSPTTPKRPSTRSKKLVDRDLATQTVSETVTVDLDDDDDGGLARNSAQSQAQQATEEVQEESDEEMAALVRQARAQRQRQEKERQAPKPQTPDLESPGGNGPSESFGLLTPPPQSDPTIQLFISSRIPNTLPLIVHRKLSQNLKEIRKVWCAKQGFSEEFTKDVYLIYRTRRVYDVTTCRSLGLDVDADGNVTMKGAEGKEGVDKVHVEAVTDEIFKEIKAEKAREERKRSGEIGEQDVEPAAGTDVVGQPKEEALIPLYFKAKGHQQPFKLKVKPTTVFSKIVSACRNHFAVGLEQSILLEFDGERLDPEHQVSSTEISDMDVVDVHIA